MNRDGYIDFDEWTERVPDVPLNDIEA